MGKVSAPKETPETLVRRFLAKFDPKSRALIRAARRALRERFPTAYELAYDNYNFFVLGYSPTDRPSEAIVSLAAGASGVNLCFLRGTALPDPGGVLLGTGKQNRFIRVASAQALGRPEIKALLAAAEAQASRAFRAKGKGELIIRSVSRKQRPRNVAGRRTMQ